MGLTKPNIYTLLPLKSEETFNKIPDRTNMSAQEGTDPSVQDGTKMSYKLESNLIYTKPLTVRNGNKKTSKKSNLKTLPKIDQPKEKIQYLAEEILSKLGDRHSQRFYYLVASRVPEPVIRNALSEIRADGAENPARVFTYRMENYAKEKTGISQEV